MLTISGHVGSPPTADTPLGVKQMVQPARVTDVSVDQVKVAPAATATVFPVYWVPSMLTRSQQLSTSHCVAVSVPATLMRIVQASLLA